MTRVYRQQVRIEPGYSQNHKLDNPINERSHQPRVSTARDLFINFQAQITSRSWKDNGARVNYAILFFLLHASFNTYCKIRDSICPRPFVQYFLRDESTSVIFYKTIVTPRILQAPRGCWPRAKCSS